MGSSVRGAAVLDPGIGGAALQALDKAGVRGVRINIVDRRENRNVMILDEFLLLGWHIEFLVQAGAVPELADVATRRALDHDRLRLNPLPCRSWSNSMFDRVIV